MERAAAVDVVTDVLETVAEDELPVPVTEVWVYGDVALGLDPIDRLDVYVTKEVLLRDDGEGEAVGAELGVEGIGSTVRSAWAREHPELVRTNEAGYAAPERCLAAQLLGDVDGPVHLEVCNSGFEDNVVQRLRGARARDAYEEVVDPRGVCLWAGGRRDDEALERLRAGGFAFPTLAEAVEMLGAEPEEAQRAASAVSERRAAADGTSVRGDVV